METFGYRRLFAYQKAKNWNKHVYSILKRFPSDERFALSSQIRRACISVTSNIAEGMSRFSVKDKGHFLEIAYGSLMEATSQLDLAQDFGYITADELRSFDLEAEEIARLISGLQRSINGSISPTNTTQDSLQSQS